MIEMRLKEYRDMANDKGICIEKVIDKVDRSSPDFIWHVWTCYNRNISRETVDNISGDVHSALLHMVKAIAANEESVTLFSEGIESKSDYLEYLIHNTSFEDEYFEEIANFTYFPELWIYACNYIQKDFEECFPDDDECKFIAHIIREMADALSNQWCVEIDEYEVKDIKESLLSIKNQIEERREYFESPEGIHDSLRYTALNMIHPLHILELGIFLQDFRFSEDEGLYISNENRYGIYVSDETRDNYDYVGIDLSCLERKKVKER